MSAPTVEILTAVNRVRLGAAQRALQEVGATVSEAAERAGFQSPYSFSNWYLKQTGLRPAEYRKRWFDMMRESASAQAERAKMSQMPARPRPLEAKAPLR